MISRFAVCVLLVLLAQCIALSPSRGDNTTVPYSDRPDVRKLEARTFNPKASLEHWPRSKAAFRLFLAELLALYPKEEIYLLARDGEYLYDLAQAVLEGHDEILSRIHLLNVSTNSKTSSHLKKYLEQEGLVAEKVSGKGVVFVDTGYSGSIPMAIIDALPKALRPELKSHMIASYNDSIPSSRLFVEAHFGKEISYNPAGNANGVETIENLPHYTNSALDYKQVQVRSTGQTRWEPVASPASNDVQESAVQLIADLKAYGETPEIKRQFFEEIKIMRQLSDAASGRSTELDTEEKLTEALLKLKEKNLSPFIGDLLECHVRGNYPTNEASMRFWSIATKISPLRLGYLTKASMFFRDFKAEELLSYYSHSIMSYIDKSKFMATLNKKLDSDTDALWRVLAWLEKEYDLRIPGRGQGKKKSTDDPLMSLLLGNAEFLMKVSEKIDHTINAQNSAEKALHLQSILRQATGYALKKAANESHTPTQWILTHDAPSRLEYILWVLSNAPSEDKATLTSLAQKIEFSPKELSHVIGQVDSISQAMQSELSKLLIQNLPTPQLLAEMLRKIPNHGSGKAWFLTQIMGKKHVAATEWLLDTRYVPDHKTKSDLTDIIRNGTFEEKTKLLKLIKEVRSERLLSDEYKMTLALDLSEKAIDHGLIKEAFDFIGAQDYWTDGAYRRLRSYITQDDNLPSREVLKTSAEELFARLLATAHDDDPRLARILSDLDIFPLESRKPMRSALRSRPRNLMTLYKKIRRVKSKSGFLSAVLDSAKSFDDLPSFIQDFFVTLSKDPRDPLRGEAKKITALGRDTVSIRDAAPDTNTGCLPSKIRSVIGRFVGSLVGHPPSF